MSPFTLAAVVLFAIVLLVHRLVQKRRGAPQPVFIPQRIPFLSHAIGIGKHGAMYYKSISERTRLPIFGLRLPFQIIYVVTEASLISKIQRHRAISFDPFVLLAAERLCGSSKSMLNLMRNEMNDGKKTPSSLMNESHVLTHSMFRSQPNLSEMVGKILNIVSHELEHTSGGDLFSWVRHTVCLASTDAVYGPKNPFRVDPGLENAFWDYDSDLSLLLLNCVPSLTARKGYLAKKRLRKAFTEYFQNGGCDQASSFVKACNEANKKRGVSAEDQAGFEVTHCIGLLVNTPPTLFWMIYHIISNPELLEQLRTELTSELVVGGEGSSEKLLDAERVVNGSPLLQSTFKEVLRVHASSLSTRIVLEDTSIGSDLLLKKGSIVHMPSACLHSDEKYFGPDTNTFEPTRFLPGSEKYPKEMSSKQQTAFRPFGGGSTLCPGRHFATMQILSITALIILLFDVSPESGEWALPKQLESTMTTTVLPPLDDIRVRFSRRKDPRVGNLQLRI